MRALLKSLILLVLVGTSTPGLAASPAALDLGVYRGKVVLVDFWASWCGPCRQSFPWLNDMYAKYADQGLVVIAVNVDPERNDAERFLRDVPAHFEVVYDPNGKLASEYEVPGMPSSYVFGRDGKLVEKHIGFRMAVRTEREAQLQKLLAGPGK